MTRHASTLSVRNYEHAVAAMPFCTRAASVDTNADNPNQGRIE